MHERAENNGIAYAILLFGFIGAAVLIFAAALQPVFDKRTAAIEEKNIALDSERDADWVILYTVKTGGVFNVSVETETIHFSSYGACKDAARRLQLSPARSCVAIY